MQSKAQQQSKAKENRILDSNSMNDFFKEQKNKLKSVIGEKKNSKRKDLN